MKKAVIVVGKHYVGKSKTINIHLKPKLGIERHQHKFTRNGKAGFILSQSFEEADRDVDSVMEKYSGYDLLVLSTRPADETGSCLSELRIKLNSAGYRVGEVVVEHNDDYAAKADEILQHLDQ
ncbi:MAG: hypothetical protein Q8Q12_05050 [bacterium]|nr:hypothetical protein [bacterium]